ncbi:hypothetical protein PC129_g12152 [Phytophthora cactorum]|uniref:Uncharacterized protein n=1 Tax=Phytophthora cactorum TaxID=29920 RepID=A0A329REX6_9STRA|nr:hypothetical protein Pcac1_g20337 [Phytophthora cactorum]KAG2813901.1 hypothetical protein PC112_g14538 [Phytophthora cactorum]KAG2817042.1 hypothetical protein PC111_g12876 [Phytophthora cactorum]KAG2853511.1 hypothetical protein PC113_g14107 [Phytophthora cactorum]KAG2896321.1 hypothetical protein PC114_g15139 [Phytophthora cactorum]
MHGMEENEDSPGIMDRISALPATRSQVQADLKDRLRQ